MQDDLLALQLYTVRDETERDFLGTLRRVAELGYTAVEFAGYGGYSAPELHGQLRSLGLHAAATHVGYAALEAHLERELAYCEALGCAFLVLPSLPPPLRVASEIEGIAARLNTIGERCRTRGITFAYHNHDFEFVQEEGVTLFERLLTATDPLTVAIELDIYWAAYAGEDPLAILRRWEGRVPLVHVKDMAPPPGREFTEVGSGELDWPTLLTAARESGATWYIVENDRPHLPSLVSAERSLAYLRGLELA